MKVTVEIPNIAVKKAAYIFLAQLNKEEEEEVVRKAVEACEKEESIAVSDDLFDDQKDQIHLVFAVAALTTKIKELEEKKESNEQAET